MRIDDDRVKKASVQRVRCGYEMLNFRDGEGVEEFATWLSGIVHQLATLGDLESDEKVVLKYLRIAGSRFKQLVLSIETLLNVPTLSIEGVTGGLKGAEDDVMETLVAEGHLLLTKEEWVEKNKKKEAEGSRSGSGNGRGGHGHGGGNRGRGRGRGGHGDGVGPLGRHGNCHRCGKPGHWAWECHSKQPKKKGATYTTQDEEQSLLLAEVETFDPLVACRGLWRRPHLWRWPGCLG
jgi:hypothetical protein